MHGVDEAKSFLNTARRHGLRDLEGDVQQLPPLRQFKPQFLSMAFHPPGMRAPSIWRKGASSSLNDGKEAFPRGGRVFSRFSGFLHDKAPKRGRGEEARIGNVDGEGLSPVIGGTAHPRELGADARGGMVAVHVRPCDKVTGLLEAVHNVSGTGAIGYGESAVPRPIREGGPAPGARRRTESSPGDRSGGRIPESLEAVAIGVAVLA